MIFLEHKSTPVVKVETFILTSERETPYLGPLGPGESVNSRGYIVRKGNGTIYPTVDRSVVVRLTTEDGSEGWGETYGICAPKATCEIINDLLAPVLIGQIPDDVESIWDDLYNLMRVRGCSSGFHMDAIAAIDIALWDLKAQAYGVSVAELIGSKLTDKVPCYLSGLPAATIDERVALACEWQKKGINAFKFAAVVSHEGIYNEFVALRKALGNECEIMVDLHWKFTADEAIELTNALDAFKPLFLEAPVKPEDISGLAEVCLHSATPIAAGEEWYTEHDARLRLSTFPVTYVQPEMAHTGITQFCRIAKLCHDKGLLVAPHATVGVGIFLAASLQVSSTLNNLWKHEWQHSVFDTNLAMLDTDMSCAAGEFHVPTGLGIGVKPNSKFWEHAELIL